MEFSCRERKNAETEIMPDCKVGDGQTEVRTEYLKLLGGRKGGLVCLDIGSASVAPPGLLFPCAETRWLSPPANFDRPAGALDIVRVDPVAVTTG